MKDKIVLNSMVIFRPDMDRMTKEHVESIYPEASTKVYRVENIRDIVGGFLYKLEGIHFTGISDAHVQLASPIHTLIATKKCTLIKS